MQTGSSLSRFSGKSQSQLVGDAVRGQKSLDNNKFQEHSKLLRALALTPLKISINSKKIQNVAPLFRGYLRPKK